MSKGKIMEFIFDQDFHIHSYLSTCSNDPRQTAEQMLNYAKENGLKSICITDHYWDKAVEGASGWYYPQDFDHLCKIKPLPTAEGIEFLFGCEAEMDQHLNISIPRNRFDDFDFVIIPTTHLHAVGLTVSDKITLTNQNRADLWVKRLEKVLEMDYPFHKVGLAHLACTLMNTTSREDYLDTLNRIPEDQMERLFSKVAKLGAGVELNTCDLRFSDQEADTVLRMFKIAKAQGCKFYCGTDAHSPEDFTGAGKLLRRAIRILGLKESDKFQLTGK